MNKAIVRRGEETARYLGEMVRETDYPKIAGGELLRTTEESKSFRSVGFLCEGHLDGQHDEICFSNRIDNPIAVLANPIEMVQAIELRDTGGTRTGAERMEPLHEKLPKRFGECVELLFGGRGHENCGDCLAQSEPQFFQNNIERLGAILVCLGQSRAGIDEIDTIFQGLQES